MKWTEVEIETCKKLLEEGKNFKEIGLIINRSHESVTKKLNRSGVKNREIDYKHPIYNERYVSKYTSYDWDKYQVLYDEGNSTYDLINNYGLTSNSILWGVNNNKLKMRDRGEALRLAFSRGKGLLSKQTGIKRYRQLCEFKFSLKDYPNRFNFSLIEKYGWYKAKNRGDNPNGVSRDHMYSVKEGFINKIDPKIISHPANCELLVHKDNNKKKTASSITIEELLKRIEKW